MRVALIASNRYPIREPFAGGLEAHVWQLARGLVDAGHHVTLFAAHGSDPGLSAGQLEVRELVVSAAASQDPSMPPAAFMADHHAYLALMTQLATVGSDSYDVVHNHSLHHLPVLLAATLATPMVCTLHTPPTPWLESALDITGGAGAEFVAVSQYTARQWRHVLADVTVVPNGVDAQAWPLGPGGKALVWFGRITPEKAPHLAIEVAHRVGMPLVLAGPISDTLYFDVEIRSRLGGLVTYAGHLPIKQLRTLLGRSAAALVTPEWDEPYGLVVAEALSCGTPVVAFARGGIPEILDDRCGRLVPPADTAAMAAAIPEAIALSRNAVRQRAVEACSSAAMLNAYVGIYRHIIERREVTGNDRLLHPSPGARPPQPSSQYLCPTRATCDRVDVDPDGGSFAVSRSGSTAAG
ncbi:glycosyl transferase family 1 [Mycolicibacterium rhodesiae]|uniref:Glycosyl transferase family 1 n=1 Tax=Mycolicibacterium rhodesiae TaxID=36814 RepID=A0A1X0IUY6_MYCRH|nr:glycosyl transferase family 1 [Mycolicibacterium rhodesiae]